MRLYGCLFAVNNDWIGVGNTHDDVVMALVTLPASQHHMMPRFRDSEARTALAAAHVMPSRTYPARLAHL